ncbi:TolC family protein [bacterium]|nr:TolC family protein [bacterium]
MKKLVINTAMIIAGFIMAMNNISYAEVNLEKGAMVDQKTFVEQALAKDPEFVTALQQYLQYKYSAVSSQEIADWTLGASATLNHYEATGSSVNSADSDSVSYELSLQKLFMPSGTRMSVAHSNTLAESESVIGTAESSSPKITFSVTQPLLKNAFGLSDRYPVVVAEIQKKSAYDDALEAWEGRIVELEKAYLDWCNAYENVKAYQAIIKELTKLERSVRRKFKAGVSDEKDMVQTEENLLRYQSLLIQTETSYMNETWNIAYLQAGQAVRDKNALNIRPDLKTRQVDGLKPVDEKAIKNLRLVKKLELLKEQQLYQKKVADNSALPSLDLIGSYGVKGEEADFNGGYAAISDKQDYTVMLQASMPLGGYKATGDKGQADAALNEINASIVNTVRSMDLSINQMAANIAMMEETLAIQEKLVKKAERKLILDNRNYEIGRLDIYYLIDTQNGLTNARLDYIKNKIQLDQLKIEYLAITDKLVLRYSDLLKQLQP